MLRALAKAATRAALGRVRLGQDRDDRAFETRDDVGMRTALIIIALWSQIAAADTPFDLEKRPHDVLDGHVQLRFPSGTELGANGESALFDYGTARLMMKATATKVDDAVPLCAAALRDIKSRGVPRASADRLAVTAPLDVCVITPPPPRYGDELLIAAYIKSPDGVDILSFYVDEGGLRDKATWLSLARRIISTASAPIHLIGELTIVGGKLTKTRGGWLFSTRVGWCRFSDDDQHTLANSKSLGNAGPWMLWKDDTGNDVIATATVAAIHADCHARSAAGLVQLRAMVETLH